MFPVFALLCLGLNIYLPHPLFLAAGALFILLHIAIHKFILLSDQTSLMWAALLLLGVGIFVPIGGLNLAFWIVAAHVTINGVRQL